MSNTVLVDFAANMQQTFHKPNETEGQHGLRMASTLEKDYNFADYSMADYDERSGFIQQAGRSTVWFVQNLFFYTKKRWIMRFGWILEFIANIVLLTVAGIHMRSSCMIEFGIEVMCYSCYGFPFLIWIASFSLLWLLNVYMHVLLISRGFTFPKPLSKVLEDNRKKGIPGIAVIVFMLLLFLMFAMIVGGIVLLVHSNHCPTVDHVAGVRTLKRSETLFWAIISIMIIALIVVPPVRFSEILGKKDHQNSDGQHIEDDEGQRYGTFQKYMDKAREKEQMYVGKFRDYREHLKEKAAEKKQMYQNKFHNQMDKFRHHGEYLDDFRGHNHGPLQAQTL